MGEQHLLSNGPLLDHNGDLAEAGYAHTLVKGYDRAAIKAPKWRIKEWDYYYVGNKDNGLALTVADNGYMWMVSMTVLDFSMRTDITKSIIGWFPLGKLKLPRDSRIGDVEFENRKKGFSMRFLHQGDKRRLICSLDRFGKNKEMFRCDILLQETTKNSMVIATPFKKQGHFYYNQKIVNLMSSGYAKVGERMIDFNKESFGVLDWGRGVWTYKNTWFWSFASGIQDGHKVGWNLGYGFGDTSHASENMLFVDGKAYKLDDVRMDIPMTSSGKDDFLKPWTFRSKGGEIALTFTPVYDRHADTNVLIIRSNQHQVFGVFSGRFLTEDGPIEIRELPGFAEKVYNRW